MQTDLSLLPLAEAARIETVRTVAESSEPGEVNRKQDSEFLETSAKEEAEAKPKNLNELQDSLAAHGIELKFSRDEETKIVVIEMIDQKTGEALRQMPSEVSIKLAAQLGKLQGLIYNRQA